MTIYVDDAGLLWRGKPRHHLMADTLPELHAFASAIGVRRCWFHNTKGLPHYDVTDDQRRAALCAGAIALKPKDLVRRYRLAQLVGQEG